MNFFSLPLSFFLHAYFPPQTFVYVSSIGCKQELLLLQYFSSRFSTLLSLVSLMSVSFFHHLDLNLVLALRCFKSNDLALFNSFIRVYYLLGRGLLGGCSKIKITSRKSATSTTLLPIYRNSYKADTIDEQNCSKTSLLHVPSWTKTLVMATPIVP